MQNSGCEPGEKHKCYRHECEIIGKETFKVEEKLLGIGNVEIVQKIRNFWAIFNELRQVSPNGPMPSNFVRLVALDGILLNSCFNELSYLTTELSKLSKIDFISELPMEINFKIMNYLDAKSLCRAAQVSKYWEMVSNNDVIWRRMCSQHIDKTCSKCGWGLPLMTASAASGPPLSSAKRILPSSSSSNTEKRVRTAAVTPSPTIAPAQVTTAYSHLSAESTANLTIDPLGPMDNALGSSHYMQMIKSWKKIYAERSVVARNWRKPLFFTKNLIGHTDGVMTMFFCEARSFLITGSIDNTLRAWNTDSGVCLAILKGHTDVIRGVQFDDSKIISCSMDKTIRIWSLGTFECVRVIQGHTSGVVSIHFIDRFLASGSVDGIVRVWNLQAGTSFTLVGHARCVNKVQILACKTQLLSCSDDGKTILWDIYKKAPIRDFVGHQGPVQSLVILKPVPLPDELRRILTASLDNTIKLWDLNTGKLLSTLFGHSDGVWGIAGDTIRIVSASQDRSVKVWDLQTGTCVYTLTSHHSGVHGIWLTDTKLISGDREGIVSVRDFSMNR